MDSNMTIIETPLTHKEIVDKLRSMTITDFNQLYQSPGAAYYGEISSYTFDIMNVQYGPMSSVPSIQGEIQENEKRSIVKVKMDVKSHFTITRNMYYGTLFPIGIIILLLSLLVLGGTKYQIHGIIFSSSFIICAVLVVILTKTSLISTKRREIKNFASKINGKIIVE